MPTHRFVAQSPLQVLMAVEAREALAAGGQHELVLLLPSEPAAVAQIRRVAHDTGWTRVVESPPRHRLPVAQANCVRRLADDPVDSLYIGDARFALMRHLCNRHEGTPIVFDDGLGVERLCRERRKGRTGDADRPSRRDRLVGLDTTEPTALTFFTIFDLEVGPNDDIIPNELRWLGSLADDVRIDPARTLLLGGCFSELGVMSDADYEAMAGRVIASEAGDVDYLPHRREPETKVERILAASGASRSSLQGPVEWSVLSRGHAPARIVTFFSTATYTLWRLFGDRIEFVIHGLDPATVDAAWLAENDMTDFLVAQTGGTLAVEPLPGQPVDR